LKPGDPKTERLEHEMLVKQTLAFERPLGIPRRVNLVRKQIVHDPKFDNNWLSFNLLCQLAGGLIGALRVTRQIPRNPYPVRDWTNGSFEPMSTESWMYGRGWVAAEYRRNDIHLYQVGLTTICLAAMGRTELEAMVAPNSVLLPALRRSFGFVVSPRMEGKRPLPCHVGLGDDPRLIPIELRITKASLRRTWTTLRRIHREWVAKWPVRVEHDELLCDAFAGCGLDSANLSPEVEEDVSQVCIPKRHVLNEREFFGRWEELVFAVHH